MTPKQKAKQLINMLYSYSDNNFSRVESALISVIEILNLLNRLENSPKVVIERNFYLEVKQELEKL